MDDGFRKIARGGFSRRRGATEIKIKNQKKIRLTGKDYKCRDANHHDRVRHRLS